MYWKHLDACNTDYMLFGNLGYHDIVNMFSANGDAFVPVDL